MELAALMYLMYFVPPLGLIECFLIPPQATAASFLPFTQPDIGKNG